MRKTATEAEGGHDAQEMEALHSPPGAPPAWNVGGDPTSNCASHHYFKEIYWNAGYRETVGPGQLFVTRPPVNSLTEPVPLCKEFSQPRNHPEVNLVRNMAEHVEFLVQLNALPSPTFLVNLELTSVCRVPPGKSNKLTEKKRRFLMQTVFWLHLQEEVQAPIHHYGAKGDHQQVKKCKPPLTWKSAVGYCMHWKFSEFLAESGGPHHEESGEGPLAKAKPSQQPQWPHEVDRGLTILIGGRT